MTEQPRQIRKIPLSGAAILRLIQGDAEVVNQAGDDWSVLLVLIAPHRAGVDDLMYAAQMRAAGHPSLRLNETQLQALLAGETLEMTDATGQGYRIVPLNVEPLCWDTYQS